MTERPIHVGRLVPGPGPNTGIPKWDCDHPDYAGTHATVGCTGEPSTEPIPNRCICGAPVEWSRELVDSLEPRNRPRPLRPARGHRSVPLSEPWRRRNRKRYF